MLLVSRCRFCDIDHTCELDMSPILIEARGYLWVALLM
jgi:hypothetical protein